MGVCLSEWMPCVYKHLQMPAESVGSPGAGVRVFVSHLMWGLGTKL